MKIRWVKSFYINLPLLFTVSQPPIAGDSLSVSELQGYYAQGKNDLKGDKIIWLHRGGQILAGVVWV